MPVAGGFPWHSWYSWISRQICGRRFRCEPTGLQQTTFANAAKIVEQGFDALGGLYGAGVYFMEETCKAVQWHY